MKDKLRIGIVCPYSFEVLGGVQSHAVDLANALRRLGHEVEVLAPANEATPIPDFVTPTGKAVGIPYNGSVARLSFGPVSYSRVKKWIQEHDFDVLHVHEPTAPSLSLLALLVAEGPIVATFHTSNPRSKMLSAFQAVLQPFLEKITARIAVSALARRVQVEHLGGNAVEIPNGVNVDFFKSAVPLEGYPRSAPTIGFVGRYDEPRKGMAVLLSALRQLMETFPELQLLVVGKGAEAELRDQAGPRLAARIVTLGQVDDYTKARALRSVDVYCAPNTGGESFGVILTEAMSAGAAVVASDIDAFRRVLADGNAGMLSAVGDPDDLAHCLRRMLTDADLRAEYVKVAQDHVTMFDWSVVADQVLRVYHSAMAADPRRVVEAGQ